jgi:hypothetical protein
MILTPAEKRAKDLERLRKLLRAEEGHRRYDTTAEATVAATLLQETVTRLKATEEGFTEEELERLRQEAGLAPESRQMVRVVIPPSDYDAPEVEHRVKWSEDLCIAVSESLFCTALAAVDPESNYLWIAGGATDVSIAAGLFRRLARTALYLLEQDRPKRASRVEREADLEQIINAFLAGGVYNPHNPEVFTNSYLIGYTSAVSRRLVSKRDELERTLPGASTALIRAQRDLVRFVEEETGGVRVEPTLHPELDIEALKKGALRGATVNLDGGELPAHKEEG